MPAANACGRFKANVNTRRRSVTGVTGSHEGRRRYAGRVDLSSVDLSSVFISYLYVSLKRKEHAPKLNETPTRLT